MPCLKIRNNNVSRVYIHQYGNLKTNICNCIANKHFNQTRLHNDIIPNFDKIKAVLAYIFFTLITEITILGSPPNEYNERRSKSVDGINYFTHSTRHLTNTMTENKDFYR